MQKHWLKTCACSESSRRMLGSIELCFFQHVIVFYITAFWHDRFFNQWCVGATDHQSASSVNLRQRSFRPLSSGHPIVCTRPKTSPTMSWRGVHKVNPRLHIPLDVFCSTPPDIDLSKLWYANFDTLETLPTYPASHTFLLVHHYDCWPYWAIEWFERREG